MRRCRTGPPETGENSKPARAFPAPRVRYNISRFCSTGAPHLEVTNSSQQLIEVPVQDRALTALQSYSDCNAIRNKQHWQHSRYLTYVANCVFYVTVHTCISNAFTGGAVSSSVAAFFSPRRVECLSL